jgi:TolB-like protein/Flp pilus assembly protein TadD
MSEEINVSKEAPARGIPLKRAVTVFILLALIAIGLGLWFGYRAPIAQAAERSVAVLPFENLSTDPDGAFFAEGVEDEIRNDLAKLADLKVINRNSVIQYKPRAKRNLREIADGLGVAHVVEGSVQRAVDRIQIRAELINAKTGTRLWGKRYDGAYDDVFAIQSDIAKTIADQLGARLSTAEKALIKEKPTDFHLAYDRYIHAGILLDGTALDARSGELRYEAVHLLEGAIAQDPKFLLAYCRLGLAHEGLYFNGYDHTPLRLQRATQAVEAALRLGPDRGESHLAAGSLYYYCYRDYDRARSELAIARRLLPNEPLVFSILGWIDRRQGRWQEHLQNVNRALELDPRNVFILHQVAGSYQVLRRYNDLMATFDRALAVTPNDSVARVARGLAELDSKATVQPAQMAVQQVLAKNSGDGAKIVDRWFNIALCARDRDDAKRALASMLQEGITWGANVLTPRSFCEGLADRVFGENEAAKNAFATAREEMETVLKKQPDYPEALSALGMIDAGLGRKEDAIREGRRAVELLPVTKDVMTGSELLRNLALIYAWTGEKELALNQIAAALQGPGHITYGQLRLHPWWDAIRDDPRFEQLVEEAKKPVEIKAKSQSPSDKLESAPASKAP